MIPPVLLNVTLPLVAVTPFTVVEKHPAAEIVPTVKPPTSLKSRLPNVVERAANVSVMSLFALSRSMLCPTLTPRFDAATSPFASCMTLPVAASSRTVPVTVTAAVRAMSPDTTHNSRSLSAVSPITTGVKHPLDDTVPKEIPSASMNDIEPVVVAVRVSKSLEAVFREMPPDPDLTPNVDAVTAPFDWMTLPVRPRVYNRTIPMVMPAVPVEMSCDSSRFPVTRHTVTLSFVVMMPFVPRTVPIVSESASR